MPSWEAHFKKLHNCPLTQNQDNEFINSITAKLNEVINSNHTIDLLDTPISMDEILTCIKSLKTGKASGPDQILNEMLHCARLSIAPCLQKVFNNIIMYEDLPRSWSIGYLVPIFKKGNSMDPDNYRGISVVSCLAKLFSKILNNRLLKFLRIDNKLSCYQIGFTEKKRTSDHIFVLKCILEEAKNKRQPVFGCFVDLKKAFDTVWRDGLFYKLLFHYKLSNKFVRLLQSMYSNLHGRVKIDQLQSSDIPLSIGLRQGCNLSPHLFNLYVDDFPHVLERACCDPVDLYVKKVNVLMYADDMLLLSKTEEGLTQALYVLSQYCQKWQLVVNVKKTKIMVFNKRGYKRRSFSFDNDTIEVVNNYTYLGILITNTGSFSNSISQLYNSALRAYFSIKAINKQNLNIPPRIWVKLFDVMVKPILLYGSEVWGAFGVKNIPQNNLLQYLMSNDKFIPEKLNIRLCKQALKLPRCASNFAARSELGRLPVMKSVLVAICKYYARLHTFDPNDLLFHALHSQKRLSASVNNSKTLTYTQMAEQLITSLQVDLKFDSKGSINLFGKNVKKAIISNYRALYCNKLNSLRTGNTSKLTLFSVLKDNTYSYESYLDSCTNFNHLTKFRLSCHSLPIERGRYQRPVTPQNERICNLCNNAVGNEFHAMFACSHTFMQDLRSTYIEKICKLSNTFISLDDLDKFVYLLSGQNNSINFMTCKWLSEINCYYKSQL